MPDAFYIVLFAHLTGLILGFGAVLVTDLYGLLWVVYRERFAHVVDVSRITGKFVWVGWGLLVAAGIPLLLLKGRVDNVMILKLAAVALVGLNGWLLHRQRAAIAGYEHGQDVPPRFMFRLVFSLGVSQLAWWTAITIGFLHRHVQSVIDWPPSPWLVVALTLATLALIRGLGDLLLGPPVEREAA